MTATRTVTATGNAVADGLMYGIAWSGPITYAFPTLAGDYTYTAEPSANFEPVNANQIAAILFALSSVSSFTNLDVVAGSNTMATLRFGQSDAPSTAYAYMPGAYEQAGDMWFGRNYDYTNAKAGNYAWHTILHEIGHAMGLKHGHEVQNGFAALPTNYDSLEFSIMTYRSYVGDNVGAYSYGIWSAPQTYMTADIAALQQIYGADFTANSGDTVYKWNPSKGDTLVNGAVEIDAGGTVIFATIWDGNGTDTYDLSAYTTSVRIDLRPGSSSTFSTAQLANLGNAHKAGGNIYNAMLFEGDTRSLIENAIGGNGDDRFRGNTIDNTFTGGKGADRFVIGTNEGHDVITDFNPNKDVIIFNGERLSIHDDGRSMVSVDFGHGQMVDIWF